PPYCFTPRRLAAPLEHTAADMMQEQPLERIAQPAYRRRERQPLDRRNILHDVAARPRRGLHAPKLNDLRPAARAIGNGAQKLMHFDAMAGFFDRLAAGAGSRIFVALKLAARQHPAIVLAALDHGDARARAAAHYDAARRLNCLARHLAQLPASHVSKNTSAMKQNARGLGAVVHNVARPLSQTSHLVLLSGLRRERKKSAQASPPLFFNGAWARLARRARHSALHRGFSVPGAVLPDADPGGFRLTRSGRLSPAFVRAASSHQRQSLVVGTDGDPRPPGSGGTFVPARRRRALLHLRNVSRRRPQ